MDSAPQIGPYRLLDPLGHGGMATVYRARHVERSVEVALKTVRDVKRSRLSALRREIVALASLSHPGIVRIVDQGVHEGVPWFAMPLLRGHGLNTLIKRAHRQALSWRENLAYATQVCAALAYLHGEGLVHRDLKPSNVIVTPEGEAVLLDFGLSHVLRAGKGELADAFRTGGTGPYMAPEQIRAEWVDARADLYALGCLIYEILTGRPPFMGADTRAVMQLHLAQQAAPPSTLRADVPAALDALVLRLLSKDWGARPGYAADVAALLQTHCEAGALHVERRDYLYRPHLVDRDALLERVCDHIDALVRHARGSFVLLGGASGSGKTRLAIEALQSASAQRCLVLTGECAPRGGRHQGAAWYPLKRSMVAIADRCRAAGADFTHAVLGRAGKVLADFEPTLGALPGLERWPEPAELPARQARARSFIALWRVLAQLSRKARPVLLVLDDLQWADPTTLAWLHHMARMQRSQPNPIMVLATYRSESRSEAIDQLIAHPATDEVTLTRLDAAGVAAMTRSMLAGDVPRSFVDFLHAESEGNPFFVAEYLRAAVAEGLVTRDARGAWRVAVQVDSAAEYALHLDLPRSLRELVARRLRALPPEARKLASYAAVLGREIETPLLAALRASRSEPALFEHVNQLIRLEVLEFTERGTLHFVHDTLRDTLLPMLSEDTRAHMHREVARALSAADDATRWLARRASHWARGRRPEDAFACYTLAAREAADHHRLDDAARFYRSALDLRDPHAPRSVPARLHLSRVLFDAGKTHEALEACAHVLDDALAHAKPRVIADARLLLAEIDRRLGDLDAALAQLSALEPLLTQLDDAALRARQRQKQGSCYHRAGQRERAEKLFRDALGLYLDLGDALGEGRVLNSLAESARQQGRFDESRELFERALRIHRQAGHRREEGNALSQLANLHRFLHQFDDARRCFEAALEIHREVGNRVLEGSTSSNLAISDSQQGRYEEARALFHEALEIHREVGNRRSEGITLSSLASCLRDMGRLQDARRRYQRALIAHRDAHDCFFEGVSSGAIAEVLMDLGLLRRARRFAALALDIHAEVHNPISAGLVHLTLAALERRSGALDACATQLDAARDAFARVDGPLIPHCAAPLRVQEGFLALARGEDARAHLDEARQLVATLCVPPGSQLGREIARLERALDDVDAGETLPLGERVEDLPAGLRVVLTEG